MNTSRSLTATLVTEFSELEQLESDWNRIRNANSSPEIFSAFSWARAFWKAYGTGLSLCTPVVYRDGHPVAIWPLVQDGHTIRCLGDPRNDYNEILCDDRDTVSVLAIAMEVLQQSPCAWTTAEFDNLPEGSPLVQHFERLKARCPYRSTLMTSAVCPAVDFRGKEAEIIRTLAKKKSIKRKLAKLRRAGQVVFRHVENRDEVERLLAVFCEQHVNRRSLAGDRSFLADLPGRQFVCELVRRLDLETELRFSVLQVDGAPVALHLGFQTDRKYVYYCPTFDLDWWDYSPGEVLLSKLLHHAVECGLREFDFTRGDESYKAKFANVIRMNHRLTLYAPTIRGTGFHMASALKEGVRKYPKLAPTAKAAGLALARASKSLSVAFCGYRSSRMAPPRSAATK